MVRESWRKMQVPLIGVVGILLIFVIVAVKLGATSHSFVGQAYTDLELHDAEFTGEYCSDLYDPVCCDDGVTYDNLCLCKAGGASPVYQGGCVE